MGFLVVVTILDRGQKNVHYAKVIVGLEFSSGFR